MPPTVIDVDAPIDVDAQPDMNPNRKDRSRRRLPVPVLPPVARRPKSPSPPIVISDSDDSDDDSIIEVEKKLARKSISSVEETAPQNFINLVSDEEEEKPQVPSRPKAQVRPQAVPSSSRISLGPDVKPSIRAKSPRINKGPPSSILPIPASSRTEDVNGKRKADQDEEDYEYMMCLDPFEKVESKDDDSLNFGESNERLEDPKFQKHRRLVHISTQPFHPWLVFAGSSSYLRDDLRLHNIRSSLRPPRYRSGKRPPLTEALEMDRLHTNYRFRRAGGSVNKILQHDGRIVACSSTAGGMNRETVTNPYNKAGTLISFSREDPHHIIDLEQGEPENLDAKHYTVHSIAYDPICNVLASSSEDKKVRTWRFDSTDAADPYVELQPYKYQLRSRVATPHDLAFKPDAPILAVGEQRLSVENLEDHSNHSFDLFDRSVRGDQHITGAIGWGSGSLIFASSEPAEDADHHRGFHKAFDVEACDTVIDFDAEEAGDALCVDATGDTLALITTDASKSFLRLYDVGGQFGTAHSTQILEADSKIEVNSVAFSPDSIYLAIGRDDNRTHVYDRRNLGRGILYDFRHDPPYVFRGAQEPGVQEPAAGPMVQNVDMGDPDVIDTEPVPHYGVVGVQWIESRFNRLGLVTGGNDGCVRLWDPLQAKGKGQVLAQAASDVASFSIGDTSKGEHRLVVGDADGTIYVLDTHPNL